MTYPQHIDPRYAQQYAPQQPQYGAPQGTPWMPPQYGGAPAGTPPQPQQLGGQGVPTAPPALGQSQRTGGGPKAPAPRHLVGRTVIFEPIRIDETTMAKDDKTGQMVSRPTAHYHLTVVDGGPLQYGDNQSRDPKQAHGMTLETQVPARFLSCQSDRFGIVNEVRDALARGDMASVGVIVQGTRGNFPFLVTKVGRDLDGNDRPDGDQRFQAATQVWNAIFSKTFTSPEPRSLVAAPPVAPPPVQYQPQPPQGATYGTAGGAPQYVAPQVAQYAGYVPAGAQQQIYPGAQQLGAEAQGYGYQPPAPQQPTPYAQQAQASAPPANPAFEAWLATLPPEQQAAQRAALAGQAQQQYTPAPQGPGI